jgi:apolipoprotein D and lipocalin family protein
MRIIILALAAAFTACGAVKPIQTVPQVDLDRFMGDWYVIASIPTIFEKGAHNAVETYQLNDKGEVLTTFRFRKGGFDGPEKVMQPKGFVRDSSNAVWGMQFLWPFKAEYRIIYLTDDYTRTVIGRSKRDYVWIMAKQATIPDAEYEQIIRYLADQGYEVGNIQKVPQRWE